MKYSSRQNIKTAEAGLDENLLHSGTRMRLVLISTLACAAAAAVTSDGAAPEVDRSARLRECLRELEGGGDDRAATRRLTTALDDTSIRTAVQLWFSDRNAAEEKYGDISTWTRK